MSQELLYHVRLKLKQGDVESIEKELNRLEKERGADSGVGGQKKSTKATEEATEALQKQESVLKTLRKEINEYKESLAQVQLQAREMGGATDGNVREQRSLAQAIADTKSKLESASRGNLDYDSALKNTGSSIREMKMSLRALKLAIDEVKNPLGKGAGKVAELTQQHNELNTSIKAVEKSMGVHTRNVGNYEESLRSAANTLAIFQGPLGPIAGRINAAATAISRYRAASAKATVATTLLGRAINVALLGGVGLLIVAFTSLLAFFRRSEKGQHALKVATAALSAIFQTFADKVADVGEFLHNAFKNPKEAVIDLGKAIMENVENRFKALPELAMAAFGVLNKGAQALAVGVRAIWNKDAREDAKRLFKEANDELTNYANALVKLATGVDEPLNKLARGFIDVKNEVEDNVSEAKILEKAMHEVLKAERDLNVERAITNRNLQEARDLARDLTVPHERRLEALRQVREAEEEMMTLELANENERMRIMKAQLDQFKSTTEQLDAHAEQQVKVANIEREHLQRSISLRRDETAVQRQLNELTLRRLRRALEEAKRTNELELAEVQRKMQKEGRMVELAEKRKVNFLEQRIEEQKAREEAYFQELVNQYEDEATARHFAELKARQELDLELIALDNNLADTKEQRHRTMVDANMTYERNEAQMQLNAELHRLSQNNNEIGMIEAERRAFQEQAERERGQRLFDIEKELRDKGMIEEDAKLEAILILQQEYSAKSAEFAQRMDNAVKANREQIMDAVANLTKNALGAIFGDSKEAAMATAIIDTYQGVVKAMASSGPPANFINAAAVGAAGLANVRKIMSTNLGSKSVDSSAAQVQAPSTNFGFVDLPSVGAEVASQQPMSQNMQPNIILEGEFDPEFLSVKVRQGNNTISGNTLGIGI